MCIANTQTKYIITLFRACHQFHGHGHNSAHCVDELRIRVATAVQRGVGAVDAAPMVMMTRRRADADGEMMMVVVVVVVVAVMW